MICSFIKNEVLAVVFLWILQNLSEHRFCRTPPDDCFSLYKYQQLTISAKKVLSQMFDWVENSLQANSINHELTLVRSLQIKPEKYSAGKYVWHHFWKGRRCLCRSNRRKGSFKKMLWEISRNSQKNMCRDLFFC